MGLIGILSELTLGLSLAEKIPALIEFHLEVLQFVELDLIERSGAVLSLEVMFPIDELGDVMQDRLVVHSSTFLLAESVLADGPAQGVAANSLAQYLHFVAATGTSPDKQYGQVFVGAGSPKTAFPRRSM